MKQTFQFKQFTIHQDRCAMKVGTDGVLLGAWTKIPNETDSILDVGAGTGLIALQMAQRSAAPVIDALELDNDAYEQCVENFEASPWADRLFCYHASFNEFVTEMDEPYNLIVCNPPFYKEKVTSNNMARDIARQAQSLPMPELLEGVGKLLSKHGSFSVVLPLTSVEDTINLAADQKLYPNRFLKVRGNPSSPFKRGFLQFSRTASQMETTTLTIETERHRYTPEYRKLTQPFYLKM